MIGVSFSNSGGPVPCLSVSTALIGVIHKGLSHAFGGSSDVLKRDRVSQIGFPRLKRRELIVKDVLLAQSSHLEYALETVFHSHFTLVLDGNG